MPSDAGDKHVVIDNLDQSGVTRVDVRDRRVEQLNEYELAWLDRRVIIDRDGE